MRDMSFEEFLKKFGATNIKIEEIHMGEPKENKQEICNLFCIALRATREFDDLEALEYWKDPEQNLEVVNARFENEAVKTVNVRMDSGVSMISDILKVIR